MKITNIKDLAKLIKETRKNLNITQQELALTSGVGVRSIVELENGTRNTGVVNVIKICSLLGLSIDID